METSNSTLKPGLKVRFRAAGSLPLKIWPTSSPVADIIAMLIPRDIHFFQSFKVSATLHRNSMAII